MHQGWPHACWTGRTSCSPHRPLLDDAGDPVPVAAQLPAPHCSTSSAALFAALGTLAGIDSMVRQGADASGGGAGDDHLPVLEVVVDQLAMQV